MRPGADVVTRPARLGVGYAVQEMAESSLPFARLGKYELLATLGRGGMGCVYRARLSGLAGASKEVALKLIHPHLAEDHDFVLMFLDEMRIAMGMAHRNIVQTFDAGQIDDYYYLVMEFVRGCSLSALLRRRIEEQAPELLPLDIALFIAMEVSAALEYAHRFRLEGREEQAGIVHRDVSPSNILLSGEGDVKLADFGVAKAARRLYVTQVNLIRGKMRYMAPEQARGKAEPRTDLYALGAVLYELLTAEAFRKDPRPEEIRRAELPPPPSTRRSGLSTSLDTLILRCLEPNPRQRPASAEEVRETLAAEAFRLQVAGGSSLDPHRRLQAFLAPYLAEQPASIAPVAGSAARMAEAMLREARAVEADSGSNAATGSGGQAEPRSVEIEEASAPVLRDMPVSSLGEEAARPTLREKPALASIGSNGPTQRSKGSFDRTSLVAAEKMSRRSGGLIITISLGLLLVVGAIFVGLRRSPAGANQIDAGARPQTQPTSISTSRMPTSRPAGAQAHNLAPAVVETVPRPSATRAPQTAPAASRPIPLAAEGRRATALPPGSLDVNSIPWAKVYIDGKYRGETPLQGLVLATGRHSLRLVNPQRQLARSFSLVVRPGQKLERVYELAPR